MKTILAAIDFSAVSRPVLTEAVNLAKAFAARVVILHVVPPPLVVASEFGPVPNPALLYGDDEEMAAQRRLRQLKHQLSRRENVEIETLCSNGAPGRSIIEQAFQVSADLIVLGSHGHSALYNLVLGGTASAVVAKAHCPVVVVPSATTPRDRGWFAGAVKREPSTRRRRAGALKA